MGPVDAGEGFGGSVYYCDTSGTWNLIPASGCSPSACAACLAANCAQGAGQASCVTETQWLSQRGPDRSSYLQMLDQECSQAAGGFSLNECKDTSCTMPGVADAGPCSWF